MADELFTPPVTGVTDAVSDHRGAGQGGGPAPRHHEGEREQPPHSFDSLEDRASVHGIPEEELTPAVQAALADLMAEIDRMRGELRHQRERIERLEHEVEHHPFLPVLNRRGLFYAAHRLWPRLTDGQVTAALLGLHVGGVERLRLRHGLAASGTALRRVAETLTAGLRQTDVVAAIGGSDFAVLMPLSDVEAAQEKGRLLARDIEALPLEWGGARHQLGVSWQAVPVTGEEAMETLLERAAPLPP